MESIKANEIDAYVIQPTLVEVLARICKLKGKEVAMEDVANFLDDFPINVTYMDQSIVLKAGLLKCEHRQVLSYIDCLVIAFCLNAKLTLHTTEKGLKSMFANLPLKTYTFKSKKTRVI
jgi:predicted nucleic acid-binding protein